MPSIPDTNAQAGVHLLLHLDKIERDKKTGRPKSNQDPWFQARPLMAKALWLDQLADARLSPAAHRLGLKLALRCGGLPLGLFKASKTLAAELGVSDAGNLRTLLGKLVDAGLLCRDTYTTKTEGKEINCYLFRVALNAGALAEAQAASAYHSPAGEMVAKAKPTGAAAAGARRDERLAELELRRRSTQPPAFTVNTPPALTVNAPTAHEQPALTVNADLAASHCDSTEQVDDGRQEPALTVNAQLKSQRAIQAVQA